MAETTAIEWTGTRLPDGSILPGATFNPWRGCAKVSLGCRNCYAETLSHRNPGTLGEWGEGANRVVAAEAYWKQPERWDREAARTGIRRKVFCASLADVFEDREDLHAPRLRLFDLIRRTPNLDWLQLTKRPENVVPALDRLMRHLGEGYDAKANRLPGAITDDEDATFMWLGDWLGGTPPANVWLGTSVENQQAADERIPHLLRTPARVRFLSCEPLLGPVDLTQIYLEPVRNHRLHNVLTGIPYDEDYECYVEEDGEPDTIHWVICGGESGPKARPMHPGWARRIRDDCKAAGVPFFFKQWGEWAPAWGAGDHLLYADGRFVEGDHDHPDAWQHKTAEPMRRDGKKAAGRRLDGAEHKAWPDARPVLA